MPSDAPPSPSRETRPGVRAWLLAIVAVVLTLGALRIASAVVMPLVVALFLIMLTWPLQEWLQRRVPRWLALTCTMIVVVAVLVGLALLVASSLGQLLDRAPELQQRLDALRQDLASRLSALGLPSIGGEDGAVRQRLSGALEQALRWAYGTSFTLGLILVYYGLGMAEVEQFRAKAQRWLADRQSREVVEITRSIATRVRRFLWGTTLSGAVNGVVTTGFTFAMGVDFAPLWGILAFALNYVMGVGPLLSVIPPVAYALLQFDGMTKPLLVLAGMGTIEFVVNNVVEPKLVGRVLSLSPVLVLFVVLLWAWLWGGAGALLAVPITVTIVEVAAHVPRLRWLAVLFSDVASGNGPAR